MKGSMAVSHGWLEFWPVVFFKNDVQTDICYWNNTTSTRGTSVTCTPFILNKTANDLKHFY
jgi:hypothetical protein